MLRGTWICVYRHQAFFLKIYQIFMQKYKTDREAQWAPWGGCVVLLAPLKRNLKKKS